VTYTTTIEQYTK